MDTKNVSFGRAFSTSLAVLLVTLSVSCSFEGIPEAEVARFCSEFEDLPLTEVSQGPLFNVYENPGTIKVIHGSGTAKHDFIRYDQNFIKVEQSQEIPEYANKATVFLNGWKSSYLGDDDQNVVGIGTLVGRIRLVDMRPGGRKLTWNAVGLLRDNDAREAYEWSYYYTVIAWNDAALNLLVNHDDADNFCKAGTGGSDNFYFAKNIGTDTALSSFSSFLQNLDFPPRGTVAILPRGFGFAWDDDNNLLQLAYNLDHSENFVKFGKKYQKAFEDVPAPLPTPISLANSGFVSWSTYSILKDNDLRRDYTFGEMVSALGGNDVGVLQPPFSILPGEDLDVGLGEAAVCQEGGERGTTSEEVIIENVPFEYAIPMLTGWDLNYACSDENVKEIGIWIDKWEYVKDPAAPTGRLSYTLSSVLRDKDDDPGHNRSHKVTILGLRPTAGGTGRQKAPDLMPFSPSGNSTTAFCRLEQGRKLRVTVKNQGNENAAASKTTIILGNKPVSLDTPAIPAGGFVDLLFDVPATCFNADCSFKITVDSNNQLDELNMKGNNSADGGCIGRPRLN